MAIVGTPQSGDVVASNYSGAISPSAGVTPVAGNRLTAIVWYIAAAQRSFDTSASTGGQTWDPVGGHFTGDSGFEVFEVRSALAAATVFSATPSAGTVDYPAVVVVERDSLDGAFGDVYVGRRDTSGAGVDQVSSGSSTPAAQPAQALAVAVDYATSATPVAAAGWTSSISFGTYGGGTAGGRLAYQRLTSLASVEAVFDDNGGTGPWDVLLLIARETGAGGTPTGQATTTETAQPMTVVGPIVAAIGQASENERAQRLHVRDYSVAGDLFFVGDNTGDESTAGGLRVVGGFGAGAAALALNQVAETELAQGFTADLDLAVGQPAEVDTALGLTPVVVLSIGSADEVNLPQAFGRAYALAIGGVAESDDAGALTVVLAETLDQVHEVDEVSTFGPVVTAVLSAVVETDESTSMTTAGALLLEATAEANEAQPVTAATTAQIGQAAEDDEAIAVSRELRAALTTAEEVDNAQAATASLVLAIAAPNEADEALTLTLGAGVLLSPAAELDDARGLTAVVLAAASQVAEIDSAAALGAALVLGITQVNETDLAVDLGAVLDLTLNQAAEQDQALTLAAGLGVVVNPLTGIGGSAARPLGW